MATAVSENVERHVSALVVALEFYPQMAIQMIHKWPPNIVLMMIQNDPNNKFMKSLNKAEKKLIRIKFQCHHQGRNMSFNVF
jgi:hypothetical protein